MSTYIHKSFSQTETQEFFKTSCIKFKKSSNDIMEVNSGDLEANFSLNYNASADVTIYVFNPYNQLIFKNNTYSTDMEKKYHVLVLNETVDLTVKYPNIHDFGKFTIMVICSEKQFNKTLKLIVNEKPKVSIENVYSLVGRPVSVTCRVTGYPKPHITWGEKKFIFIFFFLNYL